jgi:hypothetical protein
METCNSHHQHPKEAEWRCTTCGTAWCGDCIMLDMPTHYLCGDINCPGGVVRIGPDSEHDKAMIETIQEDNQEQAAAEEADAEYDNLIGEAGFSDGLQT